MCARCRPDWYRKLYARLLARHNGGYERAMAERKKKLFASLHGAVVEIGPGTGSNLRHMPLGIRWVGIEPNPFMIPYIEAEAVRYGVNAEIRGGTVESLKVAGGSADAVTGTLVLCSVADQSAALREIRRVLKPGGSFYFIEHVAAPPGTGLRLLQHILRPAWALVADGCLPDRETGRAIEQAGFAHVSYEHFTVPLPVVSPHIIGTAVK